MRTQERLPPARWIMKCLLDHHETVLNFDLRAPVTGHLEVRLMNSTKLIGVILIGVGVLVLAYQGIRYTTREKSFDLGTIHVTAEKTHTLPLPPVTGLFAMASGIFLVLFDSRKRA